MSANRKDTLTTWLKDAYAMEQGIVETLERQIGQMEDMPEAQQRVMLHLEQTKSHAQRVKGCVERMGDDVSKAKSALANVFGAVQGMSTAMADDKVVKNAMMNFAVENFEIASYAILSAAARELGEEEVARVCDGIMREEQEMADWLRQQIPMVTQKHLMSVAYS